MGKWDDPEYRRAYFRAYRLRHLAKKRAKDKAYRAANLERCRAYDLAYAASHREEAKARAKAWYYANLERAKASRKKWAEANKDANSKKAKVDRVLNPERYKQYERKRAAKKAAYNHEYTKKNPEKNRQRAHKRRIKLASLPFHKDITTKEVHERDGGICGLCNRPVDLKQATIDHIVPISKGGAHVWENVHIAHRSCNCSKGNKTAALIYSV